MEVPSSTVRGTSPLAILVDPENDIPAGERDIRLEDWLNDKIQTAVDLADLANLMATVDQRKKQLEEQVNLKFLFFSGAIHCETRDTALDLLECVGATSLWPLMSSSIT